MRTEIAPEESANQPSSNTSHPFIYLPTVYCPWKPKIALFGPVISLQMYHFLLKMLYKPQSWTMAFSYSLF